MTLEHRITRLEDNLKGQDTMREHDISIDSIIRKLGLDPETVRATARTNGQSMAEVVASQFGMSVKDFEKALRLRARGGHTTLP